MEIHNGGGIPRSPQTAAQDCESVGTGQFVMHGGDHEIVSPFRGISAPIKSTHHLNPEVAAATHQWTEASQASTEALAALGRAELDLALAQGAGKKPSNGAVETRDQATTAVGRVVQKLAKAASFLNRVTGLDRSSAIVGGGFSVGVTGVIARNEYVAVRLAGTSFDNAGLSGYRGHAYSTFAGWTGSLKEGGRDHADMGVTFAYGFYGNEHGVLKSRRLGVQIPQLIDFMIGDDFVSRTKYYATPVPGLSIMRFWYVQTPALKPFTAIPFGAMKLLTPVARAALKALKPAGLWAWKHAKPKLLETWNATGPTRQSIKETAGPTAKKVWKKIKPVADHEFGHLMAAVQERAPWLKPATEADLRFQEEDRRLQEQEIDPNAMAHALG